MGDLTGRADWVESSSPGTDVPRDGVNLRILILSFYYEPDLSAGSFRTTAFVKALTRKLPHGAEVHVVTTMPNRYQSFTSEAPVVEEYPGLRICRVRLPGHRSDLFGQAFAFFVFAQAVLRETAGQKYDIVYGTSSRLMTAALAACVARLSGAPLFLDIRDLFADTVGDVFPASYAWLLRAIFGRVERWAIRSADKVNLVSGGFVQYFRERYPHTEVAIITNGIDPEFLQTQGIASAATAQRHVDSMGPVRVLYAGNIGDGQGLHNILPRLAKRLEGQAEFRIIGDGGRKSQLLQALAESGCRNVEVLAPIPRSGLLREYRQADVLFAHLNDHEAFRKVLPSKVFEYAALGKPIWAGFAGYAADFVREEIRNAAVFAPCDDLAAARCLGDLELGETPRPEFVQRYSRDVLMERLTDDVLALARRRPHPDERNAQGAG